MHPAHVLRCFIIICLAPSTPSPLENTGAPIQSAVILSPSAVSRLSRSYHPSHPFIHATIPPCGAPAGGTAS
ncbi:hypothetical protein FIBSPDRAFT_868000 [Athelia psychrophila]|uniref:Secreted protein n=1 Tax=Athelia psychrophila TaxID=1759441 RepID=A0A166DGU7_9AGAM|nr:hypothetical protein FIBSPDRAFT_867978 [Fibularhizoctonia sp. CBS 109695]KZP14716.1 hypothetical protein FIBSPDRAFT_868000 [Fibularhizoctonia sp. CBS 109695]